MARVDKGMEHVPSTDAAGGLGTVGLNLYISDLGVSRRQRVFHLAQLTPASPCPTRHYPQRLRARSLRCQHGNQQPSSGVFLAPGRGWGTLPPTDEAVEGEEGRTGAGAQEGQ